MSAVKEIENNRFFNYLDTAASIFLVINTDHTLELVNKKGCEILGCPRDHALGKDWFKNFIPRSDRKELTQLFDQIIDGTTEPPQVYENWILGRDNQRKLIQWQSAVLKNDEGKVIGLISSGIDVTEQVILQSELRASEAKNTAILEAIPDLIFIYDSKGKIIEVRASDPELLIAPKEKLIGKNVSKVLPESSAQEIMEALKNVHRTRKTQSVEIHLSAMDRAIDFESRFVPFENDTILSVLRDITEKKEIINELNVRNRALETAGNGIVIVDAQQPDLPIIYSNKTFSRITGYKQSEVLGRNCRFLQNDDRNQEAIATVAKSIEEGEPCRVVLRNYRKDGSLFWNELTLTPLYDEEQQLTHFIGVQNDVTEIIESRKRLEVYAETLENKVEERTKELRETVQKLVETNLSLEEQITTTKTAKHKASQSQALTAAIAQNFPKGLIVVFNADYELVYVEGEELKRSDFKKTDFEGLSIDELSNFSKEQIVKIKEDIRQTLDGKSLTFEEVYQGNSYSVNSTPLYSDKKEIIWALFVYNNITEQKRIQQELTKALSAEQELNELKSRFISMASHEFRTPLSTILSSAILIGKQNGPDKVAQREKHVARIRNGVNGLVVILNDFLSLSKLEEGRVRVIPKRFELIKFSELLIEQLESTKKKEQKITLKTSKNEILLFQDPKLLSHVLINLLSNATKYSNEGQKIVLEIVSTPEEVVLIVRDQGIGIPKREQQHLFERFYRATNAVNIQGTGLGLHIVKQYTELMGGTIRFKSEKGKGSTFTVQFPQKLEDHAKNTTH